MKKILLAFTLAIVATGCYKDAQTTTTVGNGYKVEFLFEKDGVKMYRFFEGGDFHYFTNKGETTTTQYRGKTQYEENIQ